MIPKRITMSRIREDVNRLLFIDPDIRELQAQHLLVLFNKYGLWRVKLALENWQIDNLEQLLILKATKTWRTKPGKNLPFTHTEMEKMRRII